MWEFKLLFSNLRKVYLKLFSYLPTKFSFESSIFKQFAVSEYRADFCKVPNCEYHLLIHDESIDMSPFNLDLNCHFPYQSVDCLFATFMYYFPSFRGSQGFVFQKTLSATDFNRSGKFAVLTNLGLTKKRFLRKKFRKNGKSAKKECNFSFSNRSMNQINAEKKFYSEFRKVPTVPENCFWLMILLLIFSQKTVCCVLQMVCKIQFERHKKTYQFPCTECGASFATS